MDPITAFSVLAKAKAVAYAEKALISLSGTLVKKDPRAWETVPDEFVCHELGHDVGLRLGSFPTSSKLVACGDNEFAHISLSAFTSNDFLQLVSTLGGPVFHQKFLDHRVLEKTCMGWDGDMEEVVNSLASDLSDENKEALRNSGWAYSDSVNTIFSWPVCRDIVGLLNTTYDKITKPMIDAFTTAVKESGQAVISNDDLSFFWYKIPQETRDELREKYKTLESKWGENLEHVARLHAEEESNNSI